MENLNLNTVLLTDFSEASDNALKYTISLIKEAKGIINLFHVVRPDQVIKSANQLLALRAASSHNLRVEARLRSTVRAIKSGGIRASCNYSIGNLTGEIERHLHHSKPDLVVIGKKKKQNKFLGRTANYLINKYSGSLLIISQEGKFQCNTKICLACDMTDLDKNDLKESNCHNYFEKTDSPIDVHELKEYISNRNAKFLCIYRGKNRNMVSSWFFDRYPTASRLVKEIDIPLLIMKDNTAPLIC